MFVEDVALGALYTVSLFPSFASEVIVNELDKIWVTVFRAKSGKSRLGEDLGKVD